jgi:CRISPR system Cascade subunit CasA
MNLLTDPLFRVQTDEGLQRMSLPALMAALGRDEVEALVGIQRHQEDAFHVFLCYLAGAILARHGDGNPVQDEDYWRQGLRALAGKAGDDAWTLVVDDLARPAFMQPPVPKEDHDKLKPKTSTPDALDLLVTAKNHDLKQARAIHPHPDDWVYALISLQTMDGYSGRGNFGISRMNSGYGNRPVVELVHERSLGGRWRDAMLRLLEHRHKVLSAEYGYDPQGLVLVWLEPWDGRTSLPLSSLDPFYIEICRRVRLRGSDAVLRADFAPSERNRIAAEQLRGVVGDAWLPIDLDPSNKGQHFTEQALTVSPAGLTLKILRRIVFGDKVEMTALQRPLATWRGQLGLRVSVLVRGQGITEGFHEREIPIPAPVQRRVFGPPAQRDPLAELAKSAIEYADEMRDRVLKPAILAYLEGAPDRLQFDRDSARAWWRRFGERFEARWSDDYFPWLWSVPESFDERTVLREWALRIRDHAWAVLGEAEQSMPVHAGLPYRTRVLAESRFWGALFKAFPLVKEAKHEHTASS